MLPSGWPTLLSRGIVGELLRQLYLDWEWTTTQIAAHVNTIVAALLLALHDHNISVRRGGPAATRLLEGRSIRG